MGPRPLAFQHRPDDGPALPLNFLRPVQGFGNIQYNEFGFLHQLPFHARLS